MRNRKNKIILIIVFAIVIFSFRTNPVKAASETESITLTTYYPSPGGHYDTIDVRNKTTIKDKLTLLQNAILISEDVVDAFGNPIPLIDARGDIKVAGVDFNGSQFYTSNLTARKLYIRNFPDIDEWTVGSIRPYGLLSPIDCGEGMVNRILNVSFASGIPVIWASVWSPFGCISIPTGEGIHIVICAGAESFRMDYSCLEK